MNARTGRLPGLLLTAALALMARVAVVQAQQILLDKPVKAGELTLFPDLNNESIYYYVPDKVRLATDANGTPQFSFLRYVQNTRSAADQPEATEGEGGGIVHALVTLGVTPEQLAAANRELQRIKAGATIQGPVVFKSGRFGLVSSFTDPKGNLTKQVVGLGNAPLLDGEKAAVSIELTKQGSKILWQSFDMPTPDISFHFEMDMSGFRSPKRATIDADWSKIYSHRAFGAGIATTYLAAEVKDAFDELRTTDAIKITQVGEDDKMDAVIATAYKMIQDRMFEPLGGTGNPSVADLGNLGQSQPSLLDRASSRLKEMRDATAANNAEIRKQNDATRARNEKVESGQKKESQAQVKAELAERAAANAEADALTLERLAKAAARRAAAAKPRTAAVTAATASTGNADSTVFHAEKHAEADDGGAAAEAADLAKQAATARAQATKLRADADKSAVDAAGAGTPGDAHPEALKEEEKAPSFSIIASLEMKKVKQSGTFHFDMNKYTPDNMTLAFSENIGDLRSLKTDASHFREVNLDDPLFKQRELVAMVDLANAQDFGQFVNFVNVEMRKKHAGGDFTTDEVRVDRNNFNKEGNNFKLMYGWKDDNDRSKWMQYEVQSTWSLIGGKTVVVPWRAATAGAIDLSPPYRRRTVTLDGSLDSLQAAGARSVMVQVYYDVAGAEQSKQVTLNLAKGQVGDKLEILTAPEANSYAYQITWQLRGNKTITTPRQTTTADLLYVDEIPGH